MVVPLCRNSTDTAYFQRLRPYPRVLLRRCNTQFKVCVSHQPDDSECC